MKIYSIYKNYTGYNISHSKPIQILCSSHFRFLKIGEIYALMILKFYLYYDKLPPNMNDYNLLLSSDHSSYVLRHQTYQLS